MLTLWGRANSSNVQKIIWACAEIGQSFDRIDLGGPFGGLDDPAYRAMNPNGRIPTIKDGDVVLWESNAILRYLAARHPQAGLLPATLASRAVVDQWLDWQMVSLGIGLRDVMQTRSQAGSPGAQAAETHVAGQFTLLDARLAGSTHVASDDFTIADIAAGISAHRWLALPIARPALPALSRWYDGLRARPAFAAVAALPTR
mgnify:FL=1